MFVQFVIVAVPLAGVTASAVALGSGLMLDPMFPARAAVCTAIVMTLAARGSWVRSARRTFGPADRVTAIRAGLVSLLAAFLGAPGVPGIAGVVVLIAVAAAALDALDGWVARRTGTANAFGARFDMEIDALLILVLGALAWQLGKAGAWVVLSGTFRYAFVAAGWLANWMRNPLPPSLRRKAVCVVQIVSLIVAVAPVIMPPISSAMAALGLAALAGSFAADTIWLWKHRTPSQAAAAAPAAFQAGHP